MHPAEKRLEGATAKTEADDVCLAQLAGEFRLRLGQLIAWVALVHGLTLVTHSVADVRDIPDLRVEDWVAPRDRKRVAADCWVGWPDRRRMWYATWEGLWEVIAMSTEPQTELEAFHRFIGQQLVIHRSDMSVEDSVKAFRTYQHDLEQLRADIQPARDEIERGEASELDYDALKQRVAKRLADEGITD